MISHVNTQAWSDLELPLSWHDFSVGTCNLYTSVKTRSVVGLNDVTAVYLVCSDTTVVWTWKREKETSPQDGVGKLLTAKCPVLKLPCVASLNAMYTKYRNWYHKMCWHGCELNKKCHTKVGILNILRKKWCNSKAESVNFNHHNMTVFCHWEYSYTCR